ncbi:hypothetical protein ACN47E_004705 [Coniothyrium glycines]
MTHIIPQIVEDRYLDEQKLRETCQRKFAPGTYKIQFRFNKWFLYLPSPLDEDTLEKCEIDMISHSR